MWSQQKIKVTTTMLLTGSGQASRRIWLWQTLLIHGYPRLVHIAPTEPNRSEPAQLDQAICRSCAQSSITSHRSALYWLATDTANWVAQFWTRIFRQQFANSSSCDVNDPVGLHEFRTWVLCSSVGFMWRWCKQGFMQLKSGCRSPRHHPTLRVAVFASNRPRVITWSQNLLVARFLVFNHHRHHLCQRHRSPVRLRSTCLRDSQQFTSFS